MNNDKVFNIYDFGKGSLDIPQQIRFPRQEACSVTEVLIKLLGAPVFGEPQTAQEHEASVFVVISYLSFSRSSGRLKTKTD